MKRASLFIVAGMCLAVVCMAGQAQAAVLYGHGNWDKTLYRIDTDAQTTTVVGAGLVSRHGPEIEWDPTGDAVYMSDHAVSGKGLTLIDATTGLSSGSVSWSGLPGDTNTTTAMEFVGSTLYGSFHKAGPEGVPGVLGTIDTATGSVTTIGTMTGMNRPAGGLEFVDGVMYSVTATENGDSRLFTIDLATGAATAGAFFTLGGGQRDGITALAYVEGVMYTLINEDEEGDGILYSVDLATGEMTAEFNTGAMNSLTAGAAAAVAAIPEPATAALVLLGAGGLMCRRRAA